MQPLTFQNHRNKYWHRYGNYSFAAGLNSAEIAAAEIPRAALTMPLAFIRQDGSHVLTAVFSPTPGLNMYVAPDGRWMGGYVPTCLRSYPFKLVKADDSQEDVLWVDEDSGLIQSEKTGGISIFFENGELSEPLQKVRHILRQFEQNRVVTEKAVSCLTRLDVLTEWNFKLTVDGKELSASGLFRVDEILLSKLPDRQFMMLRDTGALKIAYAQLLSMGNMMKLSHLARMHKRFQSTAPAPSFSLGDDEIFRFEK